jgi:hypothetical protein
MFSQISSMHTNLPLHMKVKLELVVQRTADCRTMASWVFSTPVGTRLEYDPDDETSRAPRV